MGRYVWRKSEIITAPVYIDNPSIVMASSWVSANETRWYFKAENFNWDVVKQYMDFINFFNGFIKQNSSPIGFGILYNTLYHMTNVNGGASYTTDSIGSVYSDTTYEGYNAYMYHYGGFSSNNPQNYGGRYVRSGRVTLKESELNPLCFVCSNKADQFPENGEYGGYWYELIGSIESTQALSLSTLSADTMRDISVDEIQKGVTDGIL